MILFLEAVGSPSFTRQNENPPFGGKVNLSFVRTFRICAPSGYKMHRYIRYTHRFNLFFNQFTLQNENIKRERIYNSNTSYIKNEPYDIYQDEFIS